MNIEIAEHSAPCKPAHTHSVWARPSPHPTHHFLPVALVRALLVQHVICGVW